MPGISKNRKNKSKNSFKKYYSKIQFINKIQNNLYYIIRQYELICFLDFKRTSEETNQKWFSRRE